MPPANSITTKGVLPPRCLTNPSSFTLPVSSQETSILSRMIKYNKVYRCGRFLPLYFHHIQIWQKQISKAVENWPCRGRSFTRKHCQRISGRFQVPNTTHLLAFRKRCGYCIHTTGTVCDADCRSQRAMRDRTLFIEIMLVAIEQQLSQLATGGRGNLQLGAQRAERTSMVDVRKLNQLIHQWSLLFRHVLPDNWPHELVCTVNHF